MPLASRIRVGAVAAAVVAAAFVFWGGYGRHWSWTGINGQTATLWDWLHLLLLPIAVGILPLWLSRRVRLTRRHKAMALTACASFAVIAVAGYLVPWSWTGFTGNKLWDWLELLALPVAVALTPVLGELRSDWGRRHWAVAVTGAAIFTAIAVGGYLVPWSWTGFRGNTLWDWLHLLLLPLLIPTIVVPALKPLATAGLIAADDDGAHPAEADTGSADVSSAATAPPPSSG